MEQQIKKMKAIIIDDDSAACLDLKRRLEAQGQVKLEGIAHNGFDGLELINRTHPDVIFLDVELPDISGLDFLDRASYIKESGCSVIIYTAYDKYVLPALRKRVQDVLLKPIDDTDFEGVINRIKSKPALPSHHEVSNGNTPEEDKRYILFTNSVDFTIITKRDIGIFQYHAPSRCWEAVVAGIDHPVRLRRNVRRENIFNLGSHYVQVHQKYIINIDFLLNVVDNKCTFFPPFDNVDYVTVGRVYREKLLEKFASL